MPSLRQLGYLLALHEQQHFGRAATACFVTQSTLSVGIAELERQLGALLVERSKRSVRFTHVGEEVVARARAVVRAAEDLHAAAQGARAPLTGRLTLAAIPTVAPFLLPPMLRATAVMWPGLDLYVREMLTAAACEALHRGAVDCILLALPVECGAVEVFPLLEDRLLLALPEGEAAGEPSTCAVDPGRLLLLEGGHCLTDHALAACELASPAQDARLVASTLQTLVQLVDAGMGVTLLPEIAVEAGLLEGTRVRAHPVAKPEAARRIALAWRPGNPREADFRLLGGTIRGALDDHVRPH